MLFNSIHLRTLPAFLARPCTTPLWITWGGLETPEFARQSQVYSDAWQAAGNQCRLSAQAGADHFTVIHGLEDPNSAVCHWLAEALTRTPSKD